MAVVTRLSQLVSNYEAQPRVLSNGYVAGGSDTIGVAIVAAVAGDSIASVYKIGYLPSGVRVQDIQIQSDALTAGAFNLGIMTNDTQALNMGGPGASVATWNPATAYAIGNVVQYNGVIYYCSTANTGSAPPSGNWTTGGAVVAAPGTVPIPNVGQILGASGSLASAIANWKSIFSPTVGATAFTAANNALRVWELAGFSQDPFYDFLLTATLTTAATAGGNIALQYSWIR